MNDLLEGNKQRNRGRPVVPRVAIASPDQLTLSQPGGSDYTHKIIPTLPDFQTFLRPWDAYAEKSLELLSIKIKNTVISQYGQSQS